MPNINKVVYGNTTLIDLTDTTAEAADVAQGKYFYGKDGVKTAGTASGGGGTGTVVIEDTTDSAGGTVRTITAVDISDTTAAAADVASGKYFYTAGGVKTAGTGSGSGSDFVVSLSKNNQTGYWEPDKTWSEVYAAIVDNKTFVICIAGMTHNSELAADGAVYNDGVTVYLSYVVYETLQDKSNNYYVNEYWYRFGSTGITQDSPYIYYDTAYADATASDILSGKTAFNSSGSVSGSIPSKTSADLTANNLTVTASSGYYASAASKTLSDQNLVAGNIKKDVSIFGVTGTYEGGGGTTLTKVTGSFTPASNTQNMAITGLSGTPKFVKFCITENAFDGVLKTVAGVYVNGAYGVLITNNGGTNKGSMYNPDISGWMTDQTVSADGTTGGTSTGAKFFVTTTGFCVKGYNNNYCFRAGYTYNWEAYIPST